MHQPDHDAVNPLANVTDMTDNDFEAIYNSLPQA
jgi:hypothetical protein